MTSYVSQPPGCNITVRHPALANGVGAWSFLEDIWYARTLFFTKFHRFMQLETHYWAGLPVIYTRIYYEHGTKTRSAENLYMTNRCVRASGWLGSTAFHTDREGRTSVSSKTQNWICWSKTFLSHIFLAVSHILGSVSHLLQGLSVKRTIPGRINRLKIIADIF